MVRDGPPSPTATSRLSKRTYRFTALRTSLAFTTLAQVKALVKYNLD
jgi:hypothetical protein